MGKKGYTTFQWAIIVIGIILCFLPKYFISFEGLSASGVQVLFILIGGLLIWQCVGVDWSSLLVVLAMCFIPEIGAKTAFSSSMGNTTMIYLMLCFMLAASLQKTGVADRLAKWFITNAAAQYIMATMVMHRMPCRTRSTLPAPRFCPQYVAMVSPAVSRGEATMLCTRDAAVIDATAAEPRRFTAL